MSNTILVSADAVLISDVTATNLTSNSLVDLEAMKSNVATLLSIGADARLANVETTATGLRSLAQTAQQDVTQMLASLGNASNLVGISGNLLARASQVTTTANSLASSHTTPLGQLSARNANLTLTYTNVVSQASALSGMSTTLSTITPRIQNLESSVVSLKSSTSVTAAALANLDNVVGSLGVQSNQVQSLYASNKSLWLTLQSNISLYSNHATNVANAISNLLVEANRLSSDLAGYESRLQTLEGLVATVPNNMPTAVANTADLDLVVANLVTWVGGSIATELTSAQSVLAQASGILGSSSSQTARLQDLQNGDSGHSDSYVQLLGSNTSTTLASIVSNVSASAQSANGILTSANTSLSGTLTSLSGVSAILANCNVRGNGVSNVLVNISVSNISSDVTSAERGLSNIASQLGTLSSSGSSSTSLITNTSAFFANMSPSIVSFFDTGGTGFTAKLSTTKVAEGNASAYFIGTGLSTGSFRGIPLFPLMNRGFTVELFMYPQAYAISLGINFGLGGIVFGGPSSSTTGWRLGCTNSRQQSGTTNSYIWGNSNPMTLSSTYKMIINSKWYHVAVSYLPTGTTSSAVTVGVDGNIIGNISSAYLYSFLGSDAFYPQGSNTASSNNVEHGLHIGRGMNAYIDAVRVSGAALYQGNVGDTYTVPSTPYAASNSSIWINYLNGVNNSTTFGNGESTIPLGADNYNSLVLTNSGNLVFATDNLPQGISFDTVKGSLSDVSVSSSTLIFSRAGTFTIYLCLAVEALIVSGTAFSSRRLFFQCDRMPYRMMMYLGSHDPDAQVSMKGYSIQYTFQFSGPARVTLCTRGTGTSTIPAYGGVAVVTRIA